MAEPPSAETAEEIRELLATAVPLGLDSEEELIESLLELATYPGDEEEWIRAELARALATKAAGEATWPAELDTDRLDAVFGELEERSILCVIDAGYTRSAALEIVDEEWRERGGPDSGIAGFCYFHRQDAEHALAGSGLSLGFGAFGGDAALTVKIGRKVEHRLRGAGFDVVWDGSPDMRLRVAAIDMRRRGLMEYDDEDA